MCQEINKRIIAPKKFNALHQNISFTIKIVGANALEMNMC